MPFRAREMRSFQSAAEELLGDAEKSLWLVQNGASLEVHRDTILRMLLSVKGAAILLNLADLLEHMHRLETVLAASEQKGLSGKDTSNLLLQGIQIARTFFNAAQTGKSPAPAHANVEPSPPPPGRILVIDDEPEIVDILVEILSQEGFETRGLTASKEAMEVMQEFKPDAVFTDLSMPELDGMQLLTMVQQADPDIPVVFISGYVNKDILLRSIRLDAFGFIEKPFDIAKVIEFAKSAVDRHRQVKSLNQTVHLLVYQLAGLNDHLKSHGLDDVSSVISSEIASLLRHRNSPKTEAS